MIVLRKAEERGRANHGWLQTAHTFSFGRYYDPAQMSFRALRVMNEDFIAPDSGFPTHPHDNMEIITYVIAGALEHRDSMGNGEIISAGELQRMSAGSGITHSEYNPSDKDPIHLYQIWLMPSEQDIAPSYEQKKLTEEDKHNALALAVSPNGTDDSLRINQDARIYLGNLDAAASVSFELSADRHAWLQLLKGSVSLNDTPMSAGDGARISEETTLTITASEDSEVMLFDLA